MPPTAVAPRVPSRNDPPRSRRIPFNGLLIGLGAALVSLTHGPLTEPALPQGPTRPLTVLSATPAPPEAPAIAALGPTTEAAALLPATTTTVPTGTGAQESAMLIEPHELHTTTTTTPPPAAPTIVSQPPTTAPPAPPAPPATAAPPPPPAGTVHDVASSAQWDAAVARAVPGDTIRLIATINAPLRYRGPATDGTETKGPGGAPGRPITITAADGVWIDPGDYNNRIPALDVLGANHVHVVGVRVRRSQFGIRYLQSSGTGEFPALIRNNRVTDVGHAGIHVAGDLEQHRPSSHVRVVGNHVTDTGRTAAEFGEGIYLGYGSTEWVDRSHNLVVSGNRIARTTAEGIDIKPGTRNVTVAGNLISDLSPISGGAISAHYVGLLPNPDPGTASNIVIRDNRIWNVNLDGRAGSNDWAIWVGHGGVSIRGNAIWGMRNDPGRTRAIRIRALQDFGPHPIEISDNILWTSTGWMAEGQPSGAALVRSSGNRGPAGATGVEIPLDPHPSAPPLGAGGPADSGGGPGTALGFSR